MALLTTGQLKALLGISGSTYDTYLDAVVAATAARIKTFLGYDPETTAVTEYPNPVGGKVLTLRGAPPNCPVTITSVHEDSDSYPPTFDADTLLVAGEDYTQETTGSGTLVRITQQWPYERRRGIDRLRGTVYEQIGTVKVVYTIDTTDALAAAVLAAQMEAQAVWLTLSTGHGIGTVTADSMDGASVTLNTNARGRQTTAADGFTSPVVYGLLKDYRKIPLP